MNKSSDLLFPLDIRIERVSDGDTEAESGSLTHLVATSPQHPDFTGYATQPHEAVQWLLHHVSEAKAEARDRLPLPADMVEALLAEGYSRDLVALWAARMRGRSRRHLRTDVSSAVRLLAEYRDAGVPSVLAVGFIAVGMNADDAGRVHAAGCTAEEALPYIRAAQPSDSDWWNWPNFDVVPWIIAGFPVDRADLYGDWCTPDEAARCESFVQKHGLEDSLVLAILRSGLSAQVFEEYAAQHAALRLPMSEYVRAVLRSESW